MRLHADDEEAHRIVERNSRVTSRVHDVDVAVEA